MNRLSLFFTLFIVIIVTGSVFAQDTTRKSQPKTPVLPDVEIVPEYPGGVPAFNKFIVKNLKYPEVAKVLGLSGTVDVSFVVERDGSVTDVKPVKCLGAGCESEAARVISLMPKWTPGIQNGKMVRVMYTVPINFYYRMPYIKVMTPMRRLRNSDFGFLFYINNKTYTLKEAQAMLGKEFDPEMISSVENYDDPKYAMPEKKGVFMVVIKNI